MGQIWRGPKLNGARERRGLVSLAERAADNPQPPGSKSILGTCFKLKTDLIEAVEARMPPTLEYLG